MEKLFVINYKLRYSETSDCGAEYVKAKDKNQALDKFAKLKKIRKNKLKSSREWCWEEGIWSAELQNVKEVKEMRCPSCGGTGIIHT